MPTIAIRIFDPHTVIIVAVQVVPQPLLFDAMQFDACPSPQAICKNPEAHIHHLEHTFKHVRRVLEAVGSDANVVVDWQPEPPADAEPTSPVVLKRIIYNFFMTKCDATSVQPPTSRHAAAEALVKSVVGKPHD